MNQFPNFFTENSEKQKEFFLKDSQRLEHIFQTFSDSQVLQFHYDQAYKLSVYSEFSRKSDLPWGYYCPSPVFDLVVGNCHRGTLIKRKGKSPASHQYFFDAENQLISIHVLNVEKSYPYSYCFLIYKKYGFIGVEFKKVEGQNILNEIVECTYQDEKIQSYIRMFPDFRNSQKIRGYICETYDYENGLLASAYLYEYWFAHDVLSGPQGYLFSHDTQECFVDSQAFECKQGKIIYDSTIYPVRVKNRKAWGYMPWAINKR